METPQDRISRYMRECIERNDHNAVSAIAMFSRMVLNRGDLYAMWTLFAPYRARALEDLFRKTNNEMIGGPRYHDIDLFPVEKPPSVSKTAPKSSRMSKTGKKSGPPRRGYAATPGTGPEGEKCGSCRHDVLHKASKNYHKCELRQADWTPGLATDILFRSPACSKWEAKVI
jgi:hypothetical protein